jgi:hypothetical protein
VLDTANGDEHHLKVPEYDSNEDTLSVTSADAITLKQKIQTSTQYDAQGKPIWEDVPGDEQIVSVAE